MTTPADTSGFAAPPVDSGEFQIVCAELNAACLDEHATRGFDLLSGGFKYSDEIPGELMSRDNVVLIVSVLRRLWGYRASIIRGAVRRDLEETWQAVQVLAPLWAGFDPARRSCELSDDLAMAASAGRERIDEILEFAREGWQVRH
jgi:hypothetical protein